MGGLVLVMLKYPEPGRVKTRLAAVCGPIRAAELYRDWIGLVLSQLQPIRGHASLIGCFAGAPADQFAPWAALADEWLPQAGGDLGARLEAAFAAMHQRGGPVVAVGTDCLDLDASRIDLAFAALSTRDAVFGPVADGGYYLVGTRRHLPGFFEAIRWSSPQTLADHQARCLARGWSVGLLPMLHDIDTWDDWQAHRARQLAQTGGSVGGTTGAA